MFDDYDKYEDAFNESSDVDYSDVDCLELYDMYEEEREQEEYYFLLN